MPKARKQPCRGGKLAPVKGFQHGLVGGGPPKRTLVVNESRSDYYVVMMTHKMAIMTGHFD